jgi:two-component system, chemotaxis family, CheB/CheR fusion protein
LRLFINSAHPYDADAVTDSVSNVVAADKPGPRHQPLRVLVADDDRDAVSTMTMILRDEGHEVHCVYDGAAVISAMASFQPDVLLLDIGMPELSGYEVARYLRRRYGNDSGMVLIAVTGWKKPSDRILAKLAGFDHHLPKPLDPQALVGLLAEVQPRPQPR